MSLNIILHGKAINETSQDTLKSVVEISRAQHSAEPSDTRSEKEQKAEESALKLDDMASVDQMMSMHEQNYVNLHPRVRKSNRHSMEIDLLLVLLLLV